MARLDAGETVKGIGAAQSVAPSRVVTWLQRRRVASGRIGGHVLPKSIAPKGWLRCMAAAPITLRELAIKRAKRG
jgi:hypothetical protein